MEQGYRVPEKRQLTEELITQVDSVADSPAVRASFIWNIVRENSDVTDWDTVCFAVEALGVLSERYPYLREAAKAAAKLVYTAHYLYPNNFNSRVGEPFHSSQQQHSLGATESDGERANAPKSLFERVGDATKV